MGFVPQMPYKKYDMKVYHFFVECDNIHLFLYDNLNVQLHMEVNRIRRMKSSIWKWIPVYYPSLSISLVT